MAVCSSKAPVIDPVECKLTHLHERALEHGAEDVSRVAGPLEHLDLVDAAVELNDLHRLGGTDGEAGVRRRGEEETVGRKLDPAGVLVEVGEVHG